MKIMKIMKRKISSTLIYNLRYFFRNQQKKMAKKIKHFSEGLIFYRFIYFWFRTTYLYYSCPRNQELSLNKTLKSIFERLLFNAGSHSHYSFKMLHILENNFILSKQKNLNIYIYNDIKNLKSNLKGYLLLSLIINESTFSICHQTPSLQFFSIILNFSSNLSQIKTKSSSFIMIFLSREQFMLNYQLFEQNKLILISKNFENLKILFIERLKLHSCLLLLQYVKQERNRNAKKVNESLLKCGKINKQIAIYYIIRIEKNNYQ
ncbi:hypothetical protein ABPG74_006950 [Tetrahymena malaccensis]